MASNHFSRRETAAEDHAELEERDNACIHYFVEIYAPSFEVGNGFLGERLRRLESGNSK